MPEKQKQEHGDKHKIIPRTTLYHSIKHINYRITPRIRPYGLISIKISPHPYLTFGIGPKIHFLLTIEFIVTLTQPVPLSEVKGTRQGPRIPIRAG